MHPSSCFLAAALGDWATYITTSTELALAFPAGGLLNYVGFFSSLRKFLEIFAITQVPLAVIEALLVPYSSST